jgi:adenylate cyclase
MLVCRQATMTPQDIKRRLTAILCADVKGYSRLMTNDEAGTAQTLTTYKEAMAGLIEQHHGRVVDAPGGSLLTEFASVVATVECAVNIQKDLKERNSRLPLNRQVEFRIGINLGDIAEEDGKILGDGVNIAAYLENLTEPGGICISGMVYDQVKDKLTLCYEYLGKQTVKNIAEPFRVFRVLMEPTSRMSTWKRQGLTYWKRVHPGCKILIALVAAANTVWPLYTYFVSRPVAVVSKEKAAITLPGKPSAEIASKGRMAFPLPDEPSIAVLPFTNMSDDPKQDYLADGFAEAIIDGLSKCPHIVVIARNSSFTYKGKTVKVQQVAEELGVRNVLEGSLQKTGDAVRITVQLIDALTGQHLFSERYDRGLKDLLVMQDEITMKILDAVQVKLTAGEDARLRGKGTTNLEAYLKLMQARQYMQILNRENVALARQLTEQAIARDPRYAAAYVTLCRIQLGEHNLGVYKNPREALGQAVKLAEKAITLDSSNALAHAQLGQTYVWLKEYDKAIAEEEKAVSLDPNSAFTYFVLGSVLAWAGRPQEGIPFLKKSLRLSPVPVDPMTFIRLGTAYAQLGQYEEAVASYKKSLQLNGADDLMTHLWLASTYALMGREKEARAEAAQVLRIDPTFSLESYARRIPYKDQKAIDDSVSAWRNAGLK